MRCECSTFIYEYLNYIVGFSYNYNKLDKDKIIINNTFNEFNTNEKSTIKMRPRSNRDRDNLDLINYIYTLNN
jgi:hypothetical protein